MHEEQWHRIWEVFHAALEKPAPEREPYLESACAGDAELRREVESLLAAHEASPGFLASSDRPATWAVSAEHATGDRIGPYVIQAPIGEGGMGLVYEAQQEAPIRRRVALKVIRTGMDTREVVARFESERQALALMTHPNIARVFDGGATTEGRPYFVMELVEGVPITEYADARGLTVRQRVELFLPVCRAIQHAHQKGIVHRDVKPANVLVGEEEGRPLPKVIDFGVAKAVGQRLTERSLYTQQGRALGTPEYMSPEQAEMGPDIDTRTDVYSLGVLLYEVLTGRLPFDFAASSYSEIQRRIRTEDPLRPSTRVSRAAPEREEFAGRRGTDVAALRRELAGDLDWIVMKALEKERSRRYPSVSELAADLERALRHEPVLASPQGARYRLGKFVRRHRIGVAAAAAVATLLVAFAVTTAIQSAQIRSALMRADRERGKAERVASFLVDLFRVSDPGEARGASVPAREILDRGSERISAELDAEPEVQAALLDTMGRVYRNLGLYAKAVSLHEKALDLRRRTSGDRSPEVARSLLELGTSLQAKGEADRAERLLTGALTRQRALYGDEHLETAETLDQLGLVRHGRSEYEAAEVYYRQALDIRRKLLPAADPKVAGSIARLGGVLQARGDFDGAEQLYRDALASQESALGSDHPQTATTLWRLATVLQRKGDRIAAEDAHRKALATRRRVLGGEHPEVADSLNALAALRYDRGELETAERDYREALAIQRKALGPTHRRFAQTLNNLALVLQDKREFEPAEALYREALTINRELYGEEHTLVAGNFNNLGLMFYEKGDLSQAEPLFRRAHAILRKKLREDHPDLAFSLNNLGRVLHDRGDLAGAEPLYRRGLELRRKGLPPGHAEIASSLTSLGRLLTDRGDPAAAEPLLREAVEIRRKALAPDNWRIAETESCLGGSLVALGRGREGAQLLVSSYRALREKRGDDDPRTRQAQQRLSAHRSAAGSRKAERTTGDRTQR